MRQDLERQRQSMDALRRALPSELLNVKDSAAALRVSKLTLRRHIKDRTLPARRPGKQLRVDVGALHGPMDAQMDRSTGACAQDPVHLALKPGRCPRFQSDSDVQDLACQRGSVDREGLNTRRSEGRDTFIGVNDPGVFDGLTWPEAEELVNLARRRGVTPLPVVEPTQSPKPEDILGARLNSIRFPRSGFHADPDSMTGMSSYDFLKKVLGE
jgi:excisionase family DNA binding protein